MGVMRRSEIMEVVLEQFIPSDKPKRLSNILKNLAIAFGILALVATLGAVFIVGIALVVVAGIFFIGSYVMYVDFEYELFNGDITITKVYNASRRKIVQKINTGDVRRVYFTERKNILKKGVATYYNTNIEGLNIYTFELNNNQKVQLALNEKMEKIVKIIYVQKMRL
jgi:hypothetical protein